MITQLTHGQALRSFSNEFLNLGVDAAAFGMGKAVIASTGDVNSIYWNPAGLTKVNDIQGALMHAEYFQGIGKYDYAAFAKPINEESTFALAFIRFGVDDILNTTELIDSQGNINYDNISKFSAVDYAFNVAYARRLPLDGLDIGINGKIVHRRIGDFASSWGFGLDAALQFQTSNAWKFGLMARDITTTFNSWAFDDDRLQDIQNAIPGQNQEEPEASELTLPKLQFGVAKNFIFDYDYSLKTEFDLIMRFEQNNDLISTSFVSINPALGFEFGYIDLVYLRGGVGNFQNELQFDNTKKLSFQPNLGVGFKYKGIAIDYAITDIGDQSVALYSNVFSLKIDLGVFRR